MTTESLQKRIDEQKITDRAMELFEAQSPHQLAVTLAHFEAKHAEALSALDRMTDQRDQLVAQLKDATAQLARAADLLRGAKGFVATVFDSDIQYWADNPLLLNIGSYLGGEMPPPAAPKPEGWQLVPAEPTPEMLEAYFAGKMEAQSCTHQQRARERVSRDYKAMLAAAPKPEGQ